MSKQTRKGFNIDEQRKRDVLKVLDVILPVISIVRKWGETEKKLTRISEILKNTEAKMETLKAALDIVASDDCAKEIKKEIAKLSKKIEKASSIKDLFDNNRKNLKDDFDSYEEYCKHQPRYPGIFENVMKSIPSEDKERIIAYMFFLYNNGLYGYDVKKMPIKVYDNNYFHQQLVGGYKYMLRALEEGYI